MVVFLFFLFFYSRELIKETRVALPNNNEISQIWHDQQLAIKGLNIKSQGTVSINPAFTGAISYGADLAVLSLCNHTIVDYGTFGLWAGLLAGGKIVLPAGYSAMRSPDMMWWERADLPNVEYIHVDDLDL